MPRSKDLPVVGVAELGYMLDVTRPRVSQIVREPDFPKGIALRGGRVWPMEDIRAWAQVKGRTLRPLPASWPAAPEGGVKGAPVTAGRYKRVKR
jgi:predicted DNA-binding transcriptional regulator AlpA